MLDSSPSVLTTITEDTGFDEGQVAEADTPEPTRTLLFAGQAVLTHSHMGI